MKKNKMPKFRPILTPAAKTQTKSAKVRAQQRLEEYVQRYNTALYHCGEAKQ
jgi:hypothetical protein